MPSHSRVVIVGHLCRDCDLKYLQTGMAVCKNAIAINERKKKGDEWVETPIFIDITSWAQSAEYLTKYAKKGTLVLVDGRLSMDEWLGKDGQRRTKLYITVERASVLSSKGAAPSGGSDTPLFKEPVAQTPHSPSVSQPAVPMSVDPDDIPF